MKTLIIVLLLLVGQACLSVGVVHAGEFYLVGNGVSIHSERTYTDTELKQVSPVLNTYYEKEVRKKFNWNNSGVGVQYDQQLDNWVIGLNAGQYIDSLFKNAFYIGGHGAYRFKWADVGLTLDYHDRSKFAGIAPIPYMGVKYKKVGVNLLYIPKVDFAGTKSVNTLFFQFLMKI